MEKYREVIIFTTGLVKDPRPLLDYIYDMKIDDYLDCMRGRDRFPKIQEDLFKTLYAESVGPLPGHPLHNRYINYYQHVPVVDKDTTPVHTASKLYEFSGIKKQIPWDMEYTGHESEVQECAMSIQHPVAAVTKNLLSISRVISKYHPLTDLCLNRVVCDQLTEPDVFNLSENAQSVKLSYCKLPYEVLSHMMQQMSKCKQLRKLDMCSNTLGEAGLHLVQAIRSWGDNPPLQYLRLKDRSLPGSVCA